MPTNANIAQVQMIVQINKTHGKINQQENQPANSCYQQTNQKIKLAQQIHQLPVEIKSLITS